MNSSKRKVSSLVGVAFIGSLALGGQAFSMNDLDRGYMLSADEPTTQPKPTEGACGEDHKTDREGTCGEDHKADTEGTCGEGGKTDEEGKCGEGKCGEGKCGGA